MGLGGPARTGKRRGRKNAQMMATDKDKGLRLETPAAEWTKASREGGTNSTDPRTTFARLVGTRLQMLYPAAELGDEAEALRRLMAELAAKDL